MSIDAVLAGPATRGENIVNFLGNLVCLLARYTEQEPAFVSQPGVDDQPVEDQLLGHWLIPPLDSGIFVGSLGEQFLRRGCRIKWFFVVKSLSYRSRQ